MRSIKYFGAAFVLLALAYCKSTKTNTSSASNNTAEETKMPAVSFTPSEKQLQIAQTRWPNTTADELSQGYSIYTTNCNKCHVLYNITEFGEKKWIHEISDMAPKAELNKEQTAKLTKHILSFREANAKPKTN
ncbi:MAG: hypothetical protein JNL60_16395 [Bacteroidia bacterium]|nr:hypothetical protein [Bacteroidia bacterium]